MNGIRRLSLGSFRKASVFAPSVLPVLLPTEYQRRAARLLVSVSI